MELKSLEMQIAIPRTHDAAKTLQQFQHEGQVINENAQREMENELIHKRQNVQKQEQKDPAMLKYQNDTKQQEEQDTNSKQRQGKKGKKPIKQYHPFKGNHIDFSG